MAAGGKDEFELQRRRIEARSQVAEKEAQQNIKRQFARLGALQSGAFIKQQALERQRQQEARQGALTDVDISQAQTFRAEREAERGRQFAAEQAQLGRQFQTQERLGTQQFAGQQAQLGQQFQTQERLGAQQFAGQQAQLGREQETRLQQAGIASQEAMQRFGVKSAIQLQQDQQRWQTAERIGGQQFSAQEREAANDFLYKSQNLKQQFDENMAYAQRLWQSGETELARQEAGRQAQLMRDLTREQSALDRVLASRNLDEQIRGRQDALAFERYKLGIEKAMSDRNDKVNTINALKTQGYADTQIQAVLKDLGYQGNFSEAVLGAKFETELAELKSQFVNMKTQAQMAQGNSGGGGDYGGGTSGGGSYGGF